MCASPLEILRSGPPPPNVVLLPDALFFVRAVPVTAEGQADGAAAPVSHQAELALEAATAAGLADREADWRRQSLPADERNNAQVGLYVSLQQRRLQFSPLARDLEAYAARLPVTSRRPILTQAAQAFRDAGVVDAADEEIQQ